MYLQALYKNTIGEKTLSYINLYGYNHESSRILSKKCH